MANNNVKVTRKDYFNALRAMVEGIEAVGDYAADDVLAFIDNEIEKIDNKAAKAKEKAAEKKAETDALKDTVKSVITAEAQTVDAIVAVINDPEVTKGKVVSRLTALVKDGAVIREEIKTDAGKRTAYRLA